jgi:hypothetical protein
LHRRSNCLEWDQGVARVHNRACCLTKPTPGIRYSESKANGQIRLSGVDESDAFRRLPEPPASLLIRCVIRGSTKGFRLYSSLMKSAGFAHGLFTTVCAD